VKRDYSKVFPLEVGPFWITWAYIVDREAEVCRRQTVLFGSMFPNGPQRIHQLLT
jgi:hypothetical protein